MTGSPDVAEDILQVSFIKAYQHLAEVRGRFDAWVFRIVANGCKDWLKNIRRSHLSYDEDDQPSTYATPDEELDRTELRSDLDRALGVLPASLREAFVMKHVEGRSYEEMADLLGTTVGALKMRVHRAREAAPSTLRRRSTHNMVDDLRSDDGPGRVPAQQRRTGQTEPDARPLADREVPLGRLESETRTLAAPVHAWLDGELPEASVRRW